MKLSWGWKLTLTIIGLLLCIVFGGAQIGAIIIAPQYPQNFNITPMNYIWVVIYVILFISFIVSLVKLTRNKQQKKPK